MAAQLGLDGVSLALFAALAALPVLVALFGGAYLMSIATRIMIFAVAALSLDLLIGYGALVSFGHAAFMGIGAYAVGILASHGISDGLIALPVAIAASALFALATGALAMRTTGVYFIMITLAFGQMAFYVAVSLAPYGGDDGLTIARRSTILGAHILNNDTTFFYVTLGLLIGCFLLARRIVASRFGRVLTGARENPQRVEAMGLDPYRYRLVAYVVAGAMAGLSGFLLANQTEFASPAYMSWQRSGELIVMVLLGGVGTLSGPILGAIAFLALEESLSQMTEHWKVILGPILVGVVLAGRGGLSGLVTRFSRG